MKKRTPIRDGITAATCTLIGLAAPRAVDATEVDTSLLVYTESGNRINTFEWMTLGRVGLGRERYLDVLLTVDIMTGASANGATPADQIQTFTRPSGRGSYKVPPGATPLDDTFQDNRGAASVTLEVPMGRHSTTRIGTQGSVEYDYVSIGVNGLFTRDFNKRNTTLTAGASAGIDFLDPEGDQPIPFALMLPAGVPPIRKAKNDNKTVLDGVVGITQVIDRSTLVRLNYSINYGDGYLTDPFKVISIVDASLGPNRGEPLEYLHEHRPGVRSRQALYGRAKRHMAGDVIDFSYRYMWDDWSVRSHTAELSYLWQATERRAFEPQFRYYHQSGAGFYVHSLRDGEPLPEFATADYRLGEFDAYTIAVKVHALTPAGHMVNLRLGYYMQMGDSSPPDAIGSQLHHDLFPTVTALILQAGYTATW